jgi:hypothetical protein
MAEFTTGIEGLDAATLERQRNEALESRFEGWSPAEGGFFTWLNKPTSRIDAMLIAQLGLTLTAMFKRFGESIIGVPPILAAPASVESTWAMADDAGYTVPAGTQVTIAATGETTVGFKTAADVVVAPGSTAASVTLVAIEAGTAGNELSADPVLRDALAFVDMIALDGVTANGVDEETEDAYLARLVKRLRTLSLSLIVGEDFEIDALDFAPVYLAKCLEAYDADAEEAKALHVSLWTVDLAGQDLSAPNKAALKERQQAKVPSGVTVHTADPTRTPIKVKAKVAVKPGFDPSAVTTAAAARLTAYLDPAIWPLADFGDPGSGGGWVNRTVVRRFELVSTLDQVGGVDYVDSLELGKEGSAFGTADVELPGPVAVTEPGSIEMSAA